MAWGRRAGTSPAGATAGAMLVCAGTALWPMTTYGYDVLIEVLALCLVLRAAAGEPRATDWLVAGLAVGAAFATRYGSAALAVPAAILIVMRTPGEPGRVLRHGSLFALGCTPGIAAVLAFNHARFGSSVYTQTAAGTLQDLVVPWFSRFHWEGIAGLLVSPGKGVIWYSPPLLAVLAVLPALVRRNRAAFAAIGAYAVASLVLLGRLVFWHGEWGWGPRYVSPLLVAVVPLAWLVTEKIATRRGAAAALAGLVAAVMVQIVPVIGHPVEAHMATTVRRLSDEGVLVTFPTTRPPAPADNAILYFRPENSSSG